MYIIRYVVHAVIIEVNLLLKKKLLFNIGLQRF